MPRINRIRVNNVKYNFGTQYYDDFLMRLSCKNTIYDLANGGGKSVLMLLILQNLIPNCTLDDKQPIEKLFRDGNGNNTIHSLVEWKLDSCDVRNGFQYMTTGFCARKSRENAEEDHKNSDTANLEYFNYCIFYKGFGDNDIKNLLLKNGNERITYNGLRAYLRDLDKKDLGVETHVFDRKGDYQNFISEYGLFESQWEIIRGINKTEGHVRTYFENNYKTTRKVVEDLLIQGIIEKSYNNRIKKNLSDDEEMAKTLLEIKDKLIKLSQRKSEIHFYDAQVELLHEFIEKLKGFETVFGEMEEAQQKLVSYLIFCTKILKDKKAELEDIEKEVIALEDDAFQEERKIATMEIESELIQLDQLRQLIDETENKSKALFEEQEYLKTNLQKGEIATEYEDFMGHKKQADELKALIQNAGQEKTGLVEELKRLAATKAILVEKSTKELEEKIKTEALTIQELETHTMELQESDHLSYGEIRSKQGLDAEIEQEIKDLTKALNENMKNTDLLIVENAEENLKDLQEDLKQRKNAISKLEDKTQSFNHQYEDIKNQLNQIEMVLTLKTLEIDKFQKQLEKEASTAEKINGLKRVYGEGTVKALSETIESMFESITRDSNSIKLKIQDLKKAEQQTRRGEIPKQDENVEEVIRYLQNRYGEDIVTGKELLETMSDSQAMKTMEAFPEMPYVIFAEQSFQEIKKDKAIKTLDIGSGIITIIKKSEFHIEDIDKLNFQQEEKISVYKDIAFLWNETGRLMEAEKLLEDIDKFSEEFRRLEDRKEMIKNDLIYVRSFDQENSLENININIEKLKQEYSKAEEQKQVLLRAAEMVELEIQKAKQEIEEQRQRVEQGQSDEINYKQIILYNISINNKYQRKKENEKSLIAMQELYYHNHIKLKNIEKSLILEKQKYQQNLLRLDEIKEGFSKNYVQYMDEKSIPYENMTAEEIDAKSGAIRKLLLEEFGSLEDKEKLLYTLDSSMNKIIESIKYKGYSLEKVILEYEKGEIHPMSIQERMEIRSKLEEVEKSRGLVNESFNSESAQYNRIEGSVAHGKSQFMQKFGDYERIQSNFSYEFIQMHKQELLKIKSIKLEKQAQMKKIEDETKEIVFIKRDLERIVENAMIEIPDEHIEFVGNESVVSIKDYEQVLKRFEKLKQLQKRKIEIFYQDKQNLVEALRENQGYELADEIMTSVQAPCNVQEIEFIIQGISDTNDFIKLERDGVEQGLQDMERIKESFENRCIQICSNIKTELDRLTKLSKITLDQQGISIILLAVPYIKEEFYKQKMSSYINETVTLAETFQNMDDKVKYIRNRLSWKKLFSVIVTDMNSIKLSLYKREHIKEQSRYLRYEEAVGSTGQSQGIYIQFLIAIIHYISSLNAMGKDTGIQGKSIFIDNPFGAAKDIYIWEPIFKLLSTNHVQLIVPARGATPAITKMFEVNYILGQKMIGNKLQTVVVDYRSQIQGEEMEYNNLEYVQTALNLD